MIEARDPLPLRPYPPGQFIGQHGFADWRVQNARVDQRPMFLGNPQGSRVQGKLIDGREESSFPHGACGATPQGGAE